MVALRRRLELAPQRRDDLVARGDRATGLDGFGSANRGAGSHDDLACTQRDECGRRVGALADIGHDRLLRGKEGVANSKRRINEAARTIYVENDRTRVLFIRLVDRTLDQVRHPVVDRSGDWNDDDRAFRGHAGNDSRQTVKHQTRPNPGP